MTTIKNTITKENLIELISEKYELTKTQAKSIVNKIFEEIQEQLSKGEEISIPHFGKLHITQTSEREGVNPSTGEKIHIEAANTVKLKPASALKALVDPNRWSKSILEKKAKVAATSKEIKKEIVVEPKLKQKEIKERKLTKEDKNLIVKITNFVDEKYDSKQNMSNLIEELSVEEPTTPTITKFVCDCDCVKNKQKDIFVSTQSISEVIYKGDEVVANEYTEKTTEELKADKKVTKVMYKKSALGKKQSLKNFILVTIITFLVLMVVCAFILKIVNAIKYTGLDSNFLGTVSLNNDWVRSVGSVQAYVDYAANVMFILGVPILGIMLLIYLGYYLVTLTYTLIGKSEMNSARSENVAKNIEVITTSSSSAEMRERK